jgi:PAS domain S-box-containing protein
MLRICTELITTRFNRYKAETRLKKREKLYRHLTENIRDIIWTMNLDLEFTYYSPSVTQMMGYSVDEALKLSVADILPPKSLQRAMDVLSEELMIEELDDKDPLRARTMELEHIHKDGSIRWVELKMTGLRDENGELIEILGVTRDISDRRPDKKNI